MPLPQKTLYRRSKTRIGRARDVRERVLVLIQCQRPRAQIVIWITAG
jgi:hypothetical protein